MAESVGQIGLDLVVNQNGFNRQMQGIQGMAKKAGIALAAAFSVKKIIDFGAQCIKLGSDLAEVQNVVDVTFPTMKSQINDFAQNAAQSFGLSETMAKKFTGTFGSMAEAFGFTESEAAKMGESLTGLSGDVASFYNISQDEAYTKLKSVFSGETESLKDLGIVMTQASLDQYALANGFGKTTAKMTEQEKVSLRYKFVQDQLANAQGDFARTSDSWANQTRILSLQFDSLKASIGAGLINLLKPALVMINKVIAKVAGLAQSFKAFTEMITGKKSESGSSSFDNMAASADEASDSVNAVGDATQKAAKKAEKSLAGFDKITKLSDNSSDESTGGKGSSSAGAAKTDFGSLPQGENKALSGTSKALDSLKSKFNKVAGLFKKGFNMSVGDTGKNISGIRKGLNSIKDSFVDIATDKGVVNSAKNMIKNWAVLAGANVGTVIRVGSSVAHTLVAGISDGLKSRKDVIKKRLSSYFDVQADIAKLKTTLVTDISDILSTVITDKSSIKLVSSITKIFIDTFSGVKLLGAKFGRDLLNCIVKPIDDNKDKIKTALKNTIKPISKIVSGISDTVKDVVDKILNVYDTKVHPAMNDIATAISDVVGCILDAYNKYIAPVLNKLAGKISDMLKNHIGPMVNSIIEFVGNIIRLIGKFAKNVLAPLIKVLVDVLGPAIAFIIDGIGSTFIEAFNLAADAVKGIFDVFNSLADGTLIKVVKDFFVKAWKAITGKFDKLADWFKKIFKAAWNAIKYIFNPKNIGSFFLKAWKKIKAPFLSVADWFKGIFGDAWKFIKNAFSLKSVGNFFLKAWNKIKAPFLSVADWFKGIFGDAWDFIKGAFSIDSISNFFLKVWNGIKAPFIKVADWFKNIFSVAWTAVKDVFSKGGKIFDGIKDGIANVFKSVVDTLISGINIVIKKPFDLINGMLNTIRNVNIPVIDVKPFDGLWKENPLPIPQIPHLAQGGYVKANTPQLALIGDNRHQGEVVSPENKLIEMARKAAEMAGTGGMTYEVITLLKKILDKLDKLDLDIKLDGKSIKDSTVKLINKHTKATGVCEIKA